MAAWADKVVGGINDVGSVADAFRDALDGSARDDVKEDQEKATKMWNWRPIAIALGGVVIVVLVLRFVMKR
jgi:hypothetical protein